MVHELSSCRVRILGIDYGAKRVGLAVSDATGVVARPLKTLTRDGGDSAVLRAIVATIAELSTDDEPLAAIVIGLPRRLDGSPNEQTPRVESFAKAVGIQTGLPVALQDERLSSHEAESRLAVNEKDWRRRKPLLDAAAAAVILQDYLDSRHRPLPAEPDFS